MKMVSNAFETRRNIFKNQKSAKNHKIRKNQIVVKEMLYRRHLRVEFDTL